MKILPHIGASCLALALSACGTAPELRAASHSSGKAYMISEAQFEQLFPQRIPFYTYAGLLAAIKTYPEFGNFGSTADNQREVAAFLANIMHESHELRAITEVDTSTHDHYCNDKQDVPCAKGKQYFGRGPIQLSWNFNYALAGKALGLDLLNDPDLVSRDATVAWKTALWYWMEIKGSGPLPSHVAIKQNLGFGETVRSINGDLECSKPPTNIGYQQQQMRIQNYLKITRLIGVEPGKHQAC
ncbi:chitinase [Undibacterium sp. Ji22W]|uniref:chitinase n=1 Tax=Undibacterium sp. Ji22W TaxID=3413038 RepID=UPI003BF1FBB2